MINNLPKSWPAARELCFPEVRPVGWLDVREWPESTDADGAFEPYRDPFIEDVGWRRFGEARGTLTVPAGLETRLRINQQTAQDLSPLARLQPKDVQVLDLGSKPIMDEQLIYLAGWVGLHTLNLGGTRITGRSLRQLHGLTGLRHLAFTPVSWPPDPSRPRVPMDDELIAIEGLVNLETLYLNADQLAGPGIAYLRSLPRLYTLRLSTVRGFSSEGWARIGELRTLRNLDLSGSPLSDTNLDPIGNLTDLRELNLARTWYRDSLGFVQALKQLRAICISHTRIVDAELAHLTELPALKEVDCSENSIGDEAVLHLAAIPALNDLNLSAYDTGLSPTITMRGCQLLSQARRLEKLDLSGAGLDEEGLVHLGQLSALEELGLERTSISDVGLAHLAKLSQLRILNLWLTAVSDNGLAYLAGLSNLEELELAATQVRGPGLIHLRGLANLRKLSLGGMAEFQGRQLAQLSGLKNLEDFYLEGEGIGDEDLRHLLEYTHLQRLSLVSTRISDKRLVELSGFTRLKSLDLTGASIGDAGVPHLTQLTRLKELNLSHTRVSDAGLHSFEQLNGLERLNLLGTSVTRAGLARLKRALPNCEISG